MKRQSLVFVRIIVVAALAIAGFASSAHAAPLKDGWRYRWDDPPPLPTGSPGWTSPGFAASFQATAPDAEPPGRAGRDLLWLSIPVPAESLRDPTLFVG